VSPIPPAVDIRETVRRSGISLTDAQWDLLAGYSDALLEANKVVNLISRKDEENVWRGHILHALALTAVIRFPVGATVLDLGTGGGLPGIPLAIIRPDTSVCLVDSIQKKARAVELIVKKLALPNARVIAARAEELHSREKGTYQIIVARAVAPLLDLLKWTTKLLDHVNRMTVEIDIGGSKEAVRTPLLLAMKGGELEEEVKRAKVRYPDIQPMVGSLSGIFPGSGYLDEKKVIIVPR